MNNFLEKFKDCHNYRKTLNKIIYESTNSLNTKLLNRLNYLNSKDMSIDYSKEIMCLNNAYLRFISSYDWIINNYGSMPSTESGELDEIILQLLISNIPTDVKVITNFRKSINGDFKPSVLLLNSITLNYINVSGVINLQLIKKFMNLGYISIKLWDTNNPNENLEIKKLNNSYNSLVRFTDVSIGELSSVSNFNIDLEHDYEEKVNSSKYDIFLLAIIEDASEAVDYLKYFTNENLIIYKVKSNSIICRNKKLM